MKTERTIGLDSETPIQMSYRAGNDFARAVENEIFDLRDLDAPRIGESLRALVIADTKLFFEPIAVGFRSVNAILQKLKG